MAAPRKPIVALIYDFDGTLSPGNMQEYDFIPGLQMKSKKFWDETEIIAKEQKADYILSYMQLMLRRASEEGLPVSRKDIVKYGKNVRLFEGVQSWFERINRYAKDRGLNPEHYIVSSGLREMIAGTTIRKYIKRIYASGFWYDENNVAVWPAMAVNYTTKTQFIFRINKGCLDEWDHSSINEWVKRDKRRVPFSNMIYVGDGNTDVPCMRLVKEQGGFSIGVYPPNGSKTQVKKLIEQERVDFVVSANYKAGSKLDIAVKAQLDLISFRHDFAKAIK